MPGLVGQIHLHQDVAGEELALGVHLGAAPHLDDLLGRHQYFLELLGQPFLLGLLADRLGDLLLEARIDVNDVPARRHAVSFRYRGRTARQCASTSSTSKKNSAQRRCTMTKTMAVVTPGLLAGRPGDLDRLPVGPAAEIRPELVFAMIAVSKLVYIARPVSILAGPDARTGQRPERWLAGVEGLEPPTPGFGDRCSTN